MNTFKVTIIHNDGDVRIMHKVSAIVLLDHIVHWMRFGKLREKTAVSITIEENQ